METVLGIDFGGSKTALAVSDLDGRRLAEQVIPTRAADGGKTVLERGISAGRDLLGRVAPGHRLAAVGVSTIGIPLGRGVLLAPAIPGWEDIALEASIAPVFGVPVRVATDVKAAATAESRWGALAGTDPGVYVNLGTGLGAAVVVRGRVLEGAHGASGEIGYNLVSSAGVGREISSRQMLEDDVSGMGLAAAGSRLLGRPVTAEQVFAAAPGDPGLDAIVRAFVLELGHHLVNLAIAVDPARIAVGGGMARAWEHLERPLGQALRCGVPFPPELVLAAHPFDAPLIGALNLAAEAAGTQPADGDRSPVNNTDGRET